MLNTTSSSGDSQEIRSLRQNLEALNKLVQVSLVINSTLARRPLLEYIMQAGIDITNSEAASILLVDKNSNELRFAASTGSDPEALESIVVPMEGSIAGYIIAENRALIIDDVTTDPRHYRRIDEKVSFETRSLLGVPMRIKDRLIGVLEVLNKIEGRYSQDDVHHITILAAQAAVAIENTQLVAALRQAYADLENLNKLKNDFIAVASHELRTPLGVILGYASFLKDEAQGEMGDHAERVLHSAVHLRSLIEDMTNLRYVQLDETEMDFGVHSIGEVMNAVYNDVYSLAQAKQQAFVFEPPRGLMRVRADMPKLVMALTNVLNNAVKFTPGGGIILFGSEVQGSEVRLKVQDNGVGLSPDSLERIFDQFYQVEDPMTRRQGGLGLGLSIARAIVERHKGRIWAESGGLGSGTTFYVALPLHQ